VAGDARRLREGIEGVPIFEIYRKHLRIEPGQVGQALLDNGQQLVPVCRYPIPVPPVGYLMRELPPSLGILPPLVVVAGCLGIVVVDHHPQDPILHLPTIEESIDGFFFGLVELEDYLVEQVRTVSPCYPVRGLQEVVVIAGVVSVEAHPPRSVLRMRIMINQNRRSGMV